MTKINNASVSPPNSPLNSNSSIESRLSTSSSSNDINNLPEKDESAHVSSETPTDSSDDSDLESVMANVQMRPISPKKIAPKETAASKKSAASKGKKRENGEINGEQIVAKVPKKKKSKSPDMFVDKLQMLMEEGRTSYGVEIFAQVSTSGNSLFAQLQTEGWMKAVPKSTKNIKKPAKSAWIFFLADKRREVAQKNPEMSWGEVTRACSLLWKAVTNDERSIYEAKLSEYKKTLM
mmetsp:Transcript_2274/g.3234  ORF Transcript_2274/g.3234 Transcript_2274/m.3234 type:complete len:236 (-) Transcript_2274:65-772(-)|eukprot:CAMPEP_0171462972 /NCGR_PEP_ID=MMETSP0945-20130129/6806_1 /TAXON_ID=109269 /ORGANISM="Vaucheria litorea, Strain CCMP2940" /LENGTH=235 /DNA_ID=CAMNT_0011989625 /DNA_START=121 /DNA_END=828 /DNA_ORIENTATION=-